MLCGGVLCVSVRDVVCVWVGCLSVRGVVSVGVKDVVIVRG